MPRVTVPTPEVPGVGRGLLGAALGVALIVAGFTVPEFLPADARQRLWAGAAPIFGFWEAHASWVGTPLAVAVAALLIAGARGVDRLRLRTLLPLSYVGAVGWAVALSLIDGWRRGFTGRLQDPSEYLNDVPKVDDIGAMLRGFSGRILDYQPDSWTTHVSGHPPGAFLVFIGLDRVGLGGGTAAAWFCVLVAASAVPAMILTVLLLGSPQAARSVAPYLALSPGAVWVAVSADAAFLGVVSWGLALLAASTRTAGPRRQVLGVAAGLLLGAGVYLSYGLVLIGIPALAVLWLGRTARPLPAVLAGSLLVAGGFTAAGFWWFDGYRLVIERYYQGIATQRPAAYWAWANFAATGCAVGLATFAGLAYAVDRNLLRGRDPRAVLALAGVAAMLVADASGLSKAETERIWLPFSAYAVLAAGLLPVRHRTRWLIVQAALALAVNHLILTKW